MTDHLMPILCQEMHNAVTTGIEFLIKSLNLKIPRNPAVFTSSPTTSFLNMRSNTSSTAFSDTSISVAPASQLSQELSSTQSTGPPSYHTNDDSRIDISMDIDHIIQTEEADNGNALFALQALLGPSSQFSSQYQEQMLTSILESTLDTLYVCPTGSGKTTMYLAAAKHLAPARTIVVIVPHRPLLDEVKAKAERFGIQALEWMDMGSENVNAVSLVLVSADVAGRNSCIDMITSIGQRLHGMFIEEGQTFILHEHYREALGEAAHLRRISKPLHVFSGTVPVGQEGSMLAYFGLGPETLVKRDLTTRHNISYQVTRVESSKDVEYEAIKLVQALESQMSEDQRGVVWAQTIKQCVDVAKIINAHGHTSITHKGGLVDSWESGTDGKSKFIVATNGLAAGCDRKNVIYSIHIGNPINGLPSYLQESGRIGRSGERATSIILYKNWIEFANRDSVRSKEQSAFALVEEMKSYCENRTECRRNFQMRHMDNRHMTCMEIPDAHQCDICFEKRMKVLGKQKEARPREDSLTEDPSSKRPRLASEHAPIPGPSTSAQRAIAPPTVHESVSRYNTIQLDHNREIVLLNDYVTAIQGDCCSHCLVAGKVEYHQEEDCTAPMAHRYSSEHHTFKRSINWKKFKCCWTCQLPFLDFPHKPCVIDGFKVTRSLFAICNDPAVFARARRSCGNGVLALPSNAKDLPDWFGEQGPGRLANAHRLLAYMMALNAAPKNTA